ncbi:MAG: hypothetical protein IAI50_19270 [Candidatus Eremiobacteraeota bacterium]|nr:hypothetical protein [Candidatus Eremiobacteraeota bacterium]
MVVAPRLVRALVDRKDGSNGLPPLEFEDESVRLRPSDATRFVERFTGETIEARVDADGSFLEIAAQLRHFPVAVFVPEI